MAGRASDEPDAVHHCAGMRAAETSEHVNLRTGAARFDRHRGSRQADEAGEATRKHDGPVRPALERPHRNHCGEGWTHGMPAHLEAEVVAAQDPLGAVLEPAQLADARRQAPLHSIRASDVGLGDDLKDDAQPGPKADPSGHGQGELEVRPNRRVCVGHRHQSGRAEKWLDPIRKERTHQAVGSHPSEHALADESPRRV